MIRTCIRPLLFIDILGFSHFVMNSNFNNTVHRYIDLIRDIESVKYVDFPLKIEFLSDGMFIWIDSDDIEKSLEAITLIASNVLHNFTMEKNKYYSQYGMWVPIRGTLILDEFHIGPLKYNLGYTKDENGIEKEKLVDNFTILGKGIVRSTKWEENQQWVGISIPKDNIKNFENLAPNAFKKLKEENYLIDYFVPTKKGTSKTYAVNPLVNAMRHHEVLVRPIKKSLEEDIDKSVREKYENTLQFLNHIFTNKLESNEGMDFYRNLVKEF